MYTNNLYNRQSYRLNGYDYASEGWYFITINTHEKQPLFGKIIDGEMHLNCLGKIVHNEWLNTEKIRDNISLNKFVVMPDHFHAILEINFSKNDNNEIGVFRSTSQTIGAIVRGFKGAVTKQIKIHHLQEYNGEFIGKVWQRNYHDRIIRNEQELSRIKKYIVDNPKKYKPKKQML